MVRRSIDLLVSLIALIIAAPVLLLIAVLIRTRDGAPVLFHQRRAGLHGVPFRMIKFRTMCRNAEHSGGSLTYRADPRITPLGLFLRRHKLDEFPQLFNVLRGEMTLIGPRPEVLDWVERYTLEQREVLSSKPGLSDPVQLLLRHEQDCLKSRAEYEQLVAIKVRRQIEYLRSRNALSDAKVALGSLRALFPSNPSEEELAIYASLRTLAGGASAECPPAASCSRTPKR